MALKLVTAVTAEPITLAEAKAQCRVEGTDEDALLAGIISGVRARAEHELGGVALAPQTWERALDAFPAADIRLGIWPPTSIASIKYIDVSQIEQTLAPSAYVLDADTEPGWVRPAAGTAWPGTFDTTNAVRIRFVAGYATPASVPPDIKLWLLAQIGHWYRNREAAVAREFVPVPHLDRLLDAGRVYA